MSFGGYMALAPIRGAPPDAPNPGFPTEPSEHDDHAPETPTKSEPGQVRAPGHESDPERVAIISDNELAERLDHCKRRWQYGGKIALEARIEAGKLLKAKYDADPAFRGERYEKFAYAHGCATNKSDAHAMYTLGEWGDAYFARCEAEARLNVNFDWPSWRTAAAEIKREQKKLVDATHGADEDRDEEEDHAPLDQSSELQRERDNLEAQVKAATQQSRSERARREELEEQIAALQEQLAAREAEIVALKAIGTLRADTAPSGRQAILQDIAKMLRGRIYNARITGTTDQLVVSGYDNNRRVFVVATWPAQRDLTTEFALELANHREAKELREILASNGVTLPRGHVVINETGRFREKFTITEPAWQVSVGHEANDELLAACKVAKAINEMKDVEVNAADGKLTFGGSPFAFDRGDLEWVLRKPWREFKVCDEGIACITVPGLVGDYVVYLRGFNTGLQTARQVMMGEAEQIARITEQIDLKNLDPIADTTTDNYWLDDESPLEVIDPYRLVNRRRDLPTIKRLEDNHGLTGWRGHGERSGARQIRADFLAHWQETEPSLNAPQWLTLRPTEFWEGQDGASFADLIATLPEYEWPRHRRRIYSDEAVE